MKIVILATLLGLPALAAAQSVMPIGEPVRVITERGYTLPVYKELKVSLGADAANPGEHTVAATGLGIRYKKVVVNIPIYSAGSYLDEAVVDIDDPMASVKESSVKVLQFRFLRAASQGEIREAFLESMQANSIDPKLPAVASLLNNIPAQIAAGTIVTFYGYAANEEEDVVVIDFAGKKIRGQGKNLSTQFWSMWFGIPSDNNLAIFKAKLIGGL